MADLIRMQRELMPDEEGPAQADVHPAEVDSYRQGGWYRVEDAKQEAEPVKRGPGRPKKEPEPEAAGVGDVADN